MRRHEGLILLAAAACVLAGCSGASNKFSGQGQGNTVSASLVMQDTAPAGISVLSFEMTVTSAVLAPGNVQLVSAPITVEDTRLQVETALLSTTNIAPGTYTSLALTFSGPTMTFRNDSGSTVTVGATNCLTGQICTASPGTTSLTGTATFPGTGTTLNANTTAEILLDVNLATLLTTPVNTPNTISADFGASGALSVSEMAPGQPGSPAIEDVAGVVTAKDTVNNSITLQTGLGSYTIATGTGTTFMNFPTSACNSPGFGCVANGQIVAVDMNLQPGNSLSATRILFEDSSSAEPEVEGIVVGTTGLTPPAQFSMVVTQETPAVSGLAIGSVVTVSGQSETFDIDNLGFDTSAYSFRGTSDLMTGQEVQVQRLSTSAGSNIDAGRVRLRSSRISATVQTAAAPNFMVNNLPQFLQTAGIAQIQMGTFPATEFGGNAANVSQIVVNDSLSFRGQMFNNGGAAVLLASKIIKH